MIILILSVAMAFLISFTCSLLEAALLSLSHADIAKISEKKPAVGKIWTDFKENIHRPITVILVVNTLAHTIGATVSGSEFNSLFGDKKIWIFSLVFSFGMIIWTEIVPKTLGVKFNRKIAFLSGRPLQLLVMILNPLVIALQFISNPFKKRGKSEAHESNLVEEIGILAQFAAVNRQISIEQEGIVSRGIELSKKKVNEIMVNKNEMIFLTSEMKLIDALLKSHVYRHTRYILVQDNNLDNILGYINFKDIVSALHVNPKNASLKGISRPVLTIKEDENLAVTMNKLIKGYQHIAVIIDNKGKTVGMITLEDVIEAVVGQIGDEYDVVPDYVYNIGENLFIAAGGATLRKAGEITGYDFPTENIQLCEWIRAMNGNKMPEIETAVLYRDLKISIKKIRRGKINEVMIEKTNGG